MPSEVVLYQYPGTGELPTFSPPCLKVLLALRILDVDHEVSELRSPRDVARLSPSKRVPFVEMGGRFLGGSTLILDTLEEAHPDGVLWPRNPAARAADRAWDLVATDSLYWLGVYSRWCVPENVERFVNERVASAWRRFMIGTVFARMVRRRAAGQGVGLLRHETVLGELGRGIAMIDDGLAGGPFLGGRERPGRGDVAVTALLSQVGFANSMPRVAALLDQHPPVKALCARTFEAARLDAPPWLLSAVPAEMVP